MLVFWKARLVLLAVPKTGTTALEEAFLPWADASFLNPPRLKHMTVRRYRRQLAHVSGGGGRAAGTDGGHARARGLAVELAPLPGAGRDCRTAAIHRWRGFRRLRAGLAGRRPAGIRPLGQAVRASCPTTAARSASITCFVMTGSTRRSRSCPAGWAPRPRSRGGTSHRADPRPAFRMPRCSCCTTRRPRSSRFGTSFARRNDRAAGQCSCRATVAVRSDRLKGLGRKTEFGYVGRHLTDILLRIAGDEDDLHIGMLAQRLPGPRWGRPFRA